MEERVETAELNNLICGFVDLIHEHGQGSQQVKDFLKAHEDDKELIGLAEIVVNSTYA